MGTRYQGTDAEKLALDAYVKLVRASESVVARVHRHLEHAHLTISQFGALEALLHIGPMSQTELAQKLLKSGGNITMVIDNLEKRQLVRRDRHPEDRRVVIVGLTDAGKDLITDLFPHHVTAVMDELSVLSAAEQKELSRLCRAIGRQEER